MSVLDLQKFEGEIKAHAQCVSGVQWDHTDTSKGEEKSRAAPMPWMHHPCCRIPPVISEFFSPHPDSRTYSVLSSPASTSNKPPDSGVLPSLLPISLHGVVGPLGQGLGPGEARLHTHAQRKQGEWRP